MNDPAAYPKPVPLSRADALALLADPAPDVPGTFLAFVMLAVEPRIGEWRFAGAARSLAGALVRWIEFYESFGATPAEALNGIAGAIGQQGLEVWPRLADGWSGGPDIGTLTHRVVFFGEGGAPYDDFGLCIIEVGPDDAEPFLTRAPETHRPAEWDEFNGGDGDDD
ncbi:hypothetical protein GobsT_34280 [Gemmata obscuriglobus]|uniref:Uncharacterized protein n=1 Tax=Gemmata obscuriglobus TaxID=114 RepID=A0A2Z3H0Q6_9BACT|nr:hypothetical protein [Gemmata obscuriglobus]AWM38431.1 hypothetical protein C1280_16485 [Gemmata obscuriglobus]QEG28645.1 hypothetical protein GobsT_34280 [Gemmata obscuriglobus]VTS06846.1 unnamed protein product [Gemmata obscuriglobus UQM 2246]